MKLFTLFILVSVSCVVFTSAKKTSITAKYKMQIKMLKDQLKAEQERNKSLSLQLSSTSSFTIGCKADHKHLSSFLELRSDPVFKTMTFGFPVPRATTYQGLAGEASKMIIKKDNKKFRKLKMCPAGCIVGGDI